jgi:uncharacterized membrane protein YhaH (DUF805 family)
VPKHPIRDSALVYLLMAAVIVGISVATGGSIGRAVVVAALFYVAAMGWAWMRWRQRLRDEEGR